MFYNKKIAVIIPAYRVENWICDVINNIPDFVDLIVVVDDCSPDKTSKKVKEMNHSKVRLVRHDYNRGVGGAMKTGLEEAKKKRIDIIVKMDGDNQMDPHYLPGLLYPLIKDECDYTKGNRFSILEINNSMPLIHLLEILKGNSSTTSKVQY